jgi:hypothetical protein
MQKLTIFIGYIGMLLYLCTGEIRVMCPERMSSYYLQ